MKTKSYTREGCGEMQEVLGGTHFSPTFREAPLKLLIEQFRFNHE